eukprot:6182040-Amphidinium_carterae.1
MRIPNSAPLETRHGLAGNFILVWLAENAAVLISPPMLGFDLKASRSKRHREHLKKLRCRRSRTSRVCEWSKKNVARHSGI